MESVVILEKQGKYLIITKDSYENYDVLGQFNTKNEIIIKKKFENPKESDESYRKFLQYARQKGWKIAYCGERNGELSLNEAKKAI